MKHECRRTSFAYHAYEVGRRFLEDMPNADYYDLVCKTRWIQQGEYFAEWYEAENEPKVPLTESKQFNIKTGMLEDRKHILHLPIGKLTFLERYPTYFVEFERLEHSKLKSVNTQYIIDALLELKRVQELRENVEAQEEAKE